MDQVEIGLRELQDWLHDSLFCLLCRVPSSSPFSVMQPCRTQVLNAFSMSLIQSLAQRKFSGEVGVDCSGLYLAASPKLPRMGAAQPP